MSNYDYDVAVIGAGPGGSEAARILGRAGQKVVLIEGDKVGGTCLNRGCIPAKTMLYMAEMYRQLHKMPEYGINIDPALATVDYPGMLARRDEIMDRLRKGLTFQINKDHVELKEAYAELIDSHTIKLSTGESLTAAKIVLATGGKARHFPGFKESDERYLTSDNIFELKHIPKSMVIVGAGPVGTEFASYYHTFGTEVQIIERSDHFFDYYDSKLGQALAKDFERQGIKVHSSTMIESIDDSASELQIKLASGATLTAEYVLSAIGVVVASDYLKGAGIELAESGRVQVNDNYQTNHEHIYALGDLIGRSGSAYGAEREARNIAYQILGKDTSKAPVNYAAMPDVVFTYPEVATCGYSEQELNEQGREFATKTVQFLVNAKANIKNERRGQIWIYHDPNSEVILGVHIIGPEATELIHMAPILIHKQITVSEYLETVWGHPVMAELIKDCLVLG